MTGFSLGPMPGDSMLVAADIMMGETGHFPSIPELPDRGLGSDPIGRTASMLEGLCVDRGPRSWRLTSRPHIQTRRNWDRLEQDLDEISQVWGESVPRVKVQAVGPWSLAASVELGNGHRAITDRYALNDITDSLHVGLAHHVDEVKKRFHAEVTVQLNEPLLPQVIAGKVPATSDFDSIASFAPERVAERLAGFHVDYLHAAPLWTAVEHAHALLFSLDACQTAEELDGLAGFLGGGGRVGFGIPDAPSRETAIAIARLMDTLGLSRDLLCTHVDVYPLQSTASALHNAVNVAEMLVADAGDL